MYTSLCTHRHLRCSRTSCCRPEVVDSDVGGRSHDHHYRKCGCRRQVSKHARRATDRNCRTGNSCRATSGSCVPRDAVQRRWFARRRRSCRRTWSGSIWCRKVVRLGWRIGDQRVDFDSRSRRSGRRGSTDRRLPECTARRISAARRHIIISIGHVVVIFTALLRNFVKTRAGLVRRVRGFDSPSGRLAYPVGTWKKCIGGRQ